MTAREPRRATQSDKPAERVEEHERHMKPGEARAKIRKSRSNLKLSLRGSVERQAQLWVRKTVCTTWP